MAELRTIYEAEIGYVSESLQRLGVRYGDVEDIAHDVFVTLQRKLVDYDATRPLRPWLFGICLRIASDYRRSARIRRETGSDHISEPVDDAARPDDQLIARDARRRVLAGLDALSLEQRAVFVLHELDDISISEVAVALEIPLNTAYSRLRLARARFTAAIRRDRAVEHETSERSVRVGGSR
jgi:RNA polymerase sigma-70 factor (ECF subfamily)